MFTVHQRVFVCVCMHTIASEWWSWISTNSLHIKRRQVRQECNRKLIYLIKKLVLRSSAMSATLATSTTKTSLFLRIHFFSTRFVFLFLLLCDGACHQICLCMEQHRNVECVQLHATSAPALASALTHSDPSMKMSRTQLFPRAIYGIKYVYKCERNQV